MAASATPPPTPTRSPRAAAAAALRGLLPLAADVALHCFVAAAWAANATNAAAIAARWACGEDSAAAAATRTASFVAAVAVGVLAWPALPPLIWIVGTIVAEARREQQQQRRRRAERTGARLHQDGGGVVPVSVLVIILLASFVWLSWLIQEPSPDDASGLETASSALRDVASFVASVMACFVLVPNSNRGSLPW